MSADSHVDQPHRQQKSQLGRSIDGKTLKSYVEAGLSWLRNNQQVVNALNVFPVPDGDTGTNMVLTMQAAYDEIIDSQQRNFGVAVHSVAHGALMGARGNSGVILSQLWRGFARAMDNQEYLEAASLVHGFVEARDTAYKGVVRPVEGTILTVAKDIASAAEKALAHTNDLGEILEEVVAAASESVERTPELLINLREAGVVDAGGKGLFYILEGMMRYSKGQSLESAFAAVQPLATMNLEDTLEAIEPGQDYEVVVDFRPFTALDLDSFYSQLETMGTSIQVGEGDGIYRLHIHVPTDKRYDPIDYTMSLGTITKVAMENLIEQVEAIKEKMGVSPLKFASIQPDQIAAIAVSPGPGISHVFASLGVAAIVEGGQTMNPSTQEIITAFENLPTDHIIILPNNKNIILTAKTAAGLTTKNVAVIPSRSVPQGLAALLHLVPDGDFNEVVDEMIKALQETETGEITTATRSVEIDGVAVEQGQIIALHNGKLVLATSSLEEATLGLLEKIHAENYELITLFSGADVPKQQVSYIASLIQAKYLNQEVEVQEGGQPHYYFIISIE